MTVTRTIGAGGDHADINAWVAWVQANQVSAGNLLDHQVGQVLSGGISPTTTQTISGWAPGPSNYTTTLTAAAGASFADNSSNALAFNHASGAYVDFSATSKTYLSVQVDQFTLSRLQIKGSGAYTELVNFSSACSNGTLDTCIFSMVSGMQGPLFNGTGYSSTKGFGGSGNFLVKNCVLDVDGSGRQSQAIAHSDGVNASYDFCTILAPSGWSGTGIMTGQNGYSQTTVKNCVFVNCTNDVGVGNHGSGNPQLSYCATTHATWATNLTVSNSQTGLVPSTEFQGGASYQTDARLASTSVKLKDLGIAVSGITVDIFGTTRPQGTAPDIGAFEIVQGSASRTGTASPALPLLTSSAEGAVHVNASASPTLGLVTTASADAVKVTASASPTLPRLTAAAAGVAKVSAAASPTLVLLTAGAAGAVHVDGSASPALGLLTLSATGSTGSSQNASANPTLPLLASSAAGTVKVIANAAPTLGRVTSSAIGAVRVTGAASPTLDRLATASAARDPANASTSLSMGLPTVSAAGKAVSGATASPTLGLLQAVIAGAPVVTASLATALAAPTCTATGTTTERKGSPLYGAVVPERIYGAVAPQRFYGAVAPRRIYGMVVGGQMPKLRDLPQLDADDQVENIWVDWGNDLAQGVTMAGPVDVTVTALNGKDDDPASRKLSEPTLGTIPIEDGGTGVQNAAGMVQFGKCIGGEEYLIHWKCPRSDGTVAADDYHIRCRTPK